MTTILRAPPATVVLDGEIDIATSPAIWESLMAAINAGNLHLSLLAPSRQVRRLLEVLHLDAILPACMSGSSSRLLAG
jgi:anti-anti-sigma regulatory factor